MTQVKKKEDISNLEKSNCAMMNRSWARVSEHCYVLWRDAFLSCTSWQTFRKKILAPSSRRIEQFGFSEIFAKFLSHCTVLLTRRQGHDAVRLWEFSGLRMVTQILSRRTKYVGCNVSRTSESYVLLSLNTRNGHERRTGQFVSYI